LSAIVNKFGSAYFEYIHIGNIYTVKVDFIVKIFDKYSGSTTLEFSSYREINWNQNIHIDE